jgi:hypothetical protein
MADLQSYRCVGNTIYANRNHSGQYQAFLFFLRSAPGKLIAVRLNRWHFSKLILKHFTAQSLSIPEKQFTAI